MKVDNKIVQSGPRMVQENVIWINFNDKAIDKLFIKSGNRIIVKFRNMSVPYLTGVDYSYFGAQSSLQISQLSGS